MNIEPNNPSAESVEEEGEKVTGGATSGNENSNQENTTAASAETDNSETLPHEESKKEDITGYNELPDQAKVAGG